jgi:hypothetical protein
MGLHWGSSCCTVLNNATHMRRLLLLLLVGCRSACCRCGARVRLCLRLDAGRLPQPYTMLPRLLAMVPTAAAGGSCLHHPAPHLPFPSLTSRCGCTKRQVSGVQPTCTFTTQERHRA